MPEKAKTFFVRVLFAIGVLTSSVFGTATAFFTVATGHLAIVASGAVVIVGVVVPAMPVGVYLWSNYADRRNEGIHARWATVWSSLGVALGIYSAFDMLPFAVNQASPVLLIAHTPALVAVLIYHFSGLSVLGLTRGQARF